MPWNSNGLNDTANIKLEEYTNAIINTMKKYSLPVYDNFHNSDMLMYNSQFRQLYCQNENDVSHLNDKGHDRFIAQAEKAILSL